MSSGSIMFELAAGPTAEDRSAGRLPLGGPRRICGAALVLVVSMMPESAVMFRAVVDTAVRPETMMPATPIRRMTMAAALMPTDTSAMATGVVSAAVMPTATVMFALVPVARIGECAGHRDHRQKQC
jgi:hypothetical protein